MFPNEIFLFSYVEYFLNISPSGYETPCIVLVKEMEIFVSVDISDISITYKYCTIYDMNKLIFSTYKVLR